MSKIRILLLIVFSAVFLASGAGLVYTYYKLAGEKEVFTQLSSQVDPDKRQAVYEQIRRPPKETPPDAEEPEPIDPRELELAALQELYGFIAEENPHFVGWLRIPGTEIDYPVVQTPADPEYYLHRALDGSYSFAGTPFLDAACDLLKPSDNLIIYGHNMNNGTMFNQLALYKDPAFYRENPTLTFDTLDAFGTYEIIAVFNARILAKDEWGFRYYRFRDAQSPEDFDAYIKNIKAISFYDTGVGAEYGDNLITLSTCSYYTTDGRLAVVARRVD